MRNEREVIITNRLRSACFSGFQNSYPKGHAKEGELFTSLDIAWPTLLPDILLNHLLVQLSDCRKGLRK